MKGYNVWIVKPLSKDDIDKTDMDFFDYSLFTIFCLKNAKDLGIAVPTELEEMMNIESEDTPFRTTQSFRWIEIEGEEWLCMLVFNIYPVKFVRYLHNLEIKEAIEKGRVFDFSISKERLLAFKLYKLIRN